MSASRNKLYAVAVLALIVAVGVCTHLFRIGYPATPVFDEIHFATYSADFASSRPFYDIHPLFGKMIYAAALSCYPAAVFAHASFLKLAMESGGYLAIIPSHIPFGDFPYVALRLVDSLAGILLPVAFYFFLKNIGASRIAALFGAFFLLFENALVLSTRLILLDGFYLLFGIATLAFYFARPRFTVAAGIMWGLCLSVKLTGIVFVGPLVASYLLASSHERKKELLTMARFACVAFIAFVVVGLAGTIRYTPSSWFSAVKSLGMQTPSIAWQTAHPGDAYVEASIEEVGTSLHGYTEGAPSAGESPWYFWPLMQSPITLYESSSGKDVTFTGNPVTWPLGTLAVIIALAVSIRYFKKWRKGASDLRPLFLLLGGYVAVIYPFIAIVHRGTYLYHYFPALIFSYGLLGFFAARIIGANDFSDLTLKKTSVLVLVVLIAALGFYSAAPATYGF